MPREFHSYRVEAVVLRHMNWGEADRLLTLFTRQQGKITVVAKGVRKIRSRKAGHLEPFTRVSLQLAKSHTHPFVTQAETIDAHIPLRENLILLSQASYVVELLDKFTYEEGEHLSLYNLLDQTLSRLSDPASEPLVVLRYYEMRLLDYVGFRPVMFACVVCGEPVRPEDQFFSAEKGGVVGPECAQRLAGLRPISMDALRYLRHFQRSSYPEAARADPSPETHREMEGLMQHYLTYVLERGLNSPIFLRKVNR